MRAWLKRISSLIGIVLSGMLILACIHYFLPLPFFPILDAMSIAVPWLMVANGFYLALCLLFRTKRFLLPLTGLLIAILSFGSFYGFTAQVAGSTPQEAFTLMTYNVRGFNARGYYEPKNGGEQIVAFTEQQQPDIVCFQEFNRTFFPYFKKFKNRIITPVTSGKSPQAIFSRFPILRSEVISFPESANSALFADILIGSDTLRVYNVHLQSYQIPSREFLYADNGRNFLKRLNRVALKHRQQAQLVQDHAEDSPYPVILCGDLNATPFSRPYRVLSKGMYDTFKKKGQKWGATYYLNQMLPYRIDVVLVSPGIEVAKHQNFDIRASDHLPVQVTLKIQGE
ncbi:MAG: endonuclease/exonuclease/phosphatase family protein [Robiginitalea sp.]|uniref:endonuclease/exonuclease/phosphatase family protein n=1 Tax=Robiginitalea sp. TaxID=1902411 RepID=UPI003C73507B